ncbi:MAG: hypothetical protein PVI43_04990 [Candidatus Bathyarchaeota archaeon]|jgi:hypothetical protein
MARRHRPSIPLIILFIILLLLFFLAGPLLEIVSGMTTRGTFTFSFSSLDPEPVVSIVYTLPQDLADAIVVEEPEGWTVTLEGTSLSLTDGTLNPGESITVNFKLKDYIKGGPRTIPVTATKEEGGSLDTPPSTLEIPEVFLLALMAMLSANAIWLLILAIIVLVLIIVLFILGKRKEEEQETKEGETSPENPKKQD